MSGMRSYNDGNKEFTSSMLVYSSPFGRLAVEGESRFLTTHLRSYKKTCGCSTTKPVKKIDTPETADAKMES